jgi:hypothetical protein
VIKKNYVLHTCRFLQTVLIKPNNTVLPDVSITHRPEYFRNLFRRNQNRKVCWNRKVCCKRIGGFTIADSLQLEVYQGRKSTEPSLVVEDYDVAICMDMATPGELFIVVSNVRASVRI